MATVATATVAVATATVATAEAMASGRQVADFGRTRRSDSSCIGSVVKARRLCVACTKYQSMISHDQSGRPISRLTVVWTQVSRYGDSVQLYTFTPWHEACTVNYCMAAHVGG